MAVPLTGVEILFPIAYQFNSDKLITETDQGGFQVTQKNSTSARIEECILNLKIRGTELKTFYDYIKANFGDIVTFTKTGIQIFNNASTSQSVRIVGYTSPVKIENRQYSMSIKMRKV